LKMRWLLTTFFCTALFLSLPHQARAQWEESSGRGLIWYESLTGSSSSLGTVTRFDSTLGYNFNPHFAADFGVPVLFVHASSSTATTSSTSTTTTGFRSANGIGDVYSDLRFSFRNPAVNFISNIRGSLPTGSTSNGFSSGRVSADWNNHFDHAFGHVTPYGEVGVANTVPQSAYFERPFTTLGLLGHFEGGAAVSIWRHLDFHASVYAIEPSGQQKVF